ncbi:MAG: Spy/CpxP family protein refolding chaperone [Phocaeicola sp.]
MKKAIVSFVFACFIGSVAVVAQTPRGERPDQGKRVEQMVKELDLTEKQSVELKEVMEGMRPSSNGNSGERPSREEMQKKHEEMDAKIKKILTKDQYKKYKETQSQGRQKR